MKKFLLALASVAMFASAASATTVYFENTDNWAKVNAYCWTPEVKGWPGTEVTTKVTASGREFYAYEVPGAQQNIIFNNGSGVQTENLDVIDGVVYSTKNLKGTACSDHIGTIKDGVFTAAGEVVIEYATVYVPVSEYNKNVAYIYSWGEEIFGNPGAEMTKATVGDTEYWSVKVDQRKLGTVNGWLLHNGSWGEKTADLPSVTFQDGYEYHLDGTSAKVGEGTVDPTPDPTPGDFTGWYVNMGGTFVSGDYWKGEEVPESGIVTLPEYAIGTNEFKIKVWDGTKDTYYGKGEIAVGEWVELPVGVENNTMTIAGATEGAKYIAKFNCNTNELMLTAVGGTVDPTPEITPLYLVGATMGWDTTAKNKMTGDADGNYTIHLDKLVGEFKITTDVVNGVWNDDLTFSAQKDLTIGEATECVSGGGLGNMTIGLGVTNATVEFNIGSKVIKVTGTPITEVVTKYFIKGNFYDTNWPSVEMLKGEDGLYSATIIPMDNENCEFIVYKTNDGVEAAWYKGCTAEVGKTVTMSTDGENATVVLEDRNTYKFSFNPETLALTVDKTSGVADIEAAEEVPAVYYNLQGVRVDNPENGLFLEVRGNVVRKVVK